MAVGGSLVGCLVAVGCFLLCVLCCGTLIVR